MGFTAPAPQQQNDTTRAMTDYVDDPSQQKRQNLAITMRGIYREIRTSATAKIGKGTRENLCADDILPKLVESVHTILSSCITSKIPEQKNLFLLHAGILFSSEQALECYGEDAYIDTSIATAVIIAATDLHVESFPNSYHDCVTKQELDEEGNLVGTSYAQKFKQLYTQQQQQLLESARSMLTNCDELELHCDAPKKVFLSKLRIEIKDIVVSLKTIDKMQEIAPGEEYIKNTSEKIKSLMSKVEEHETKHTFFGSAWDNFRISVNGFCSLFFQGTKKKHDAFEGLRILAKTVQPHAWMQASAKPNLSAEPAAAVQPPTV